MPVKQDHLTSRIGEAWKLAERMVIGGWASGSSLFALGYRAGYQAGKDDAHREWIDNTKAMMSGHEVPSREALPTNQKGDALKEQG